ncbi:hypothetical protein DFH09DRAFT_1292237 [Mycena vulgaris]|nr:hypothetical protein DFH09DRAFT_1292237 [Mycena vulgaris]
MFNDLASGLAQLTEQVGNSQYRPSKTRRAAFSGGPSTSLPRNFGLIAPSAFVAPSPPSPPPALFPTLTINISPTGAVASSLPPQAAPFFSSSIPLSQSSSFNNSFNIPPPPPPSVPHLSAPSTPAHVSTLDADVPNTKWEVLCRKFPPSQLAAHKWTWTSGNWIPVYEFPYIADITSVWMEWVDGVDGCIPVEMLTKTWPSRGGQNWMRNLGKLKTESSRRMKIVKLVQDLAMRPRWSVDTALRFLAEKYEPRYKVRAFAKYLTDDKGANISAVFIAADTFLR